MYIARMLRVATRAEVLARFGHALSDPTRSRILLGLREGPADLADTLGVSRTNLSNRRRTRYEVAEPTLARALGNLVGLVLSVDPQAGPSGESQGCC